MGWTEADASVRVIGLVHVCGHVLFPDTQGHGLSVGASPAHVRKDQLKTTPERFAAGVPHLDPPSSDVPFDMVVQSLFNTRKLRVTVCKYKYTRFVHRAISSKRLAGASKLPAQSIVLRRDCTPTRKISARPSNRPILPMSKKV